MNQQALNSNLGGVMGVKFGFAFCFTPGNQESYAVVLCRSIRTYGGKHKNAPVYALIPNNSLDKLQQECLTALSEMEVELVPYSFNLPDSSYHYSHKTIAAGVAEAYAEGKADQLIYTDVDSVILNDPTLMTLAENKLLGIRPVDIKNIGLTWDEPLDDFWAAVYEKLKVPQDRVFPVLSTVDYDKMRAYFNSCLITVRPETGLLRKWSSNFINLCDDPVWIPFCNSDERYRTFLHQAILTATLLRELTEEEFEIYPIHVNFPLYSYPRHPHKPQWVNELLTCRLDMLNVDDCWKTWLPVREPLRSWLINQFEEIKSIP